MIENKPPTNRDAAPYRVQLEQTDLAFLYDQYWEHARHAENQLWNYTRIWALILTAIVTVLGSSLPRNAKIGATLFGIFLSVLGLLLIYALRVSYVSFVYKSEVVAVNEMGVHPEYTRYLRDWTADIDERRRAREGGLFRFPFAGLLSRVVRSVLPRLDADQRGDGIVKDKHLDMPDVLKLAYSVVVLAGLSFLGVLLGNPVAGFITALAVSYLIVVYDRIGRRSKERARANVSEPLDVRKLERPLEHLETRE